MSAESPSMARVRNARGGLLLTHPFFGVLSLKIALRESSDVPTAGVTSKELVFNPAFVDGLSNHELRGLIAHEVMHLGLCHHARQGTRDHQLWNIAADFAINPVLIDDGFILPKGALLDSAFKGMSAEAIYDKLRDSAKPITADGSGATGTFDSAGPEGSAEAGESAREWQEYAQEALRAASSAGKLPQHLRRVITESLAGKADWRALLRRFMTDQVRVRSTWSKRNKRFPDIYMPGRQRDGMGALVVGVDTSGSVSPEVLARFGAEISAIAADVEPSVIHVVYCDADVNHVESFEHGEEIKLEPHGGGGTDFRPVFEYVANEGLRPECLIYLTDMCGRFPDVEPEYPVLWAAYGAGGIVAPMGETVVIDG